MTAAEGAALEPYDFRTGSEMSREALSHLRAQCDGLASALGRIMHAYLDCPVEFQVAAPEALTFEQYLGELPEGALMGLVEVSARVPDMWWQMDAALTGAVLGRMLGGPPVEMERRATALEMAVLKRFFQELVDIWSSSSERLARWKARASQVVADGGGLQTAVQAGEMVRVTMKAEVSEVTGQLDLLLPVATAQRLVGEESADAETIATVDASHASRAAGAISVPVAVLVHRGRVSLAEAMRLSEGDILPLGKPLDDPLTITVRGQVKFLAQGGLRSGRVAARILGPAPDATP